MADVISIGIAGATGYVGQELIRLAARHPAVRVTTAMASGDTDTVRTLPGLARVWDGEVTPLSIDRLVAETEAQLGPADILVLNAAVNPYMGPFLDTPDDAFDKTIAVNIRANMQLAKRVVPGMQAKGGGAIVIVSSIAAFKGSKMLGIYAVTKAADIQIVRNLASAYGPDNIRVNGIAPAVVKTDFARALYEDPEREKQVSASYALKRLGEPDDIAGAALFFSSRAGAWTTGQTLIIDGGWSIEES